MRKKPRSVAKVDICFNMAKFCYLFLPLHQHRSPNCESQILNPMKSSKTSSSHNPFAYKARASKKKKPSGKRIGKSKAAKADNQLNRRVR